MSATGSRRFYYGWVVVGVTALALLISAGVRSAPSVLVHPLETEFGWSRAAIAFAISLGLLLYGLAGPLSGSLIDRYGPKPLLLGGLALSALSMGAAATLSQLWQLNLFLGILGGLGTGAAASVLGAAVANRWFVARRGLVMGLFGAAASAGQLIFIPALMFLVVTLGWRGSVALLAVAAGLALLPALFFMRNDPADLGLRPYGAGAAASVEAGSDEGVLRRAVRAPAFWLLSGSFFICGATSSGLIGTHLIPHAIDHGVAEVTAAGVLGLMGTMNFIGTLGSGWLTDRLPPHLLLVGYYGFRSLSLFLLPFVGDAAGLSVFAVIYGLDFMATVPPTSALAADLFGRRHVGTVFGWIFFSHQVGAALAAWLGGLVHDALGDYGAAFLAAGLLAVTAALLSLRLGGAQRLSNAPARP
ncbi:MAG: MFS transporter [Chloroflexota bacterium]